MCGSLVGVLAEGGGDPLHGVDERSSISWPVVMGTACILYLVAMIPLSFESRRVGYALPSPGGEIIESWDGLRSLGVAQVVLCMVCCTFGSRLSSDSRRELLVITTDSGAMPVVVVRVSDGRDRRS